MTQFLFDYGLFLVKSITVALALAWFFGGLISTIFELKKNARAEQERQHIQMTALNEQYEEAQYLFNSMVLDEKRFKKWKKEKEKEEEPVDKPIVFVIDFDGDIEASPTDDLREYISFIIQVAQPERDRVLLRLESAGGLVFAYGLAASQLHRLREHNIHLSICVDKIAASGGYMMACLGHEVIAAPFAVLGSIGVIGSLPNIHRLLKKHDIDYEEHTAGKYKRTLTVMGENTDEDRQQFQHELNLTHDLFKQHIQQYRPQLDVEAVATGETWYGSQALEKQLIDRLGTSDDELLRYAQSHRLYVLSRQHSRPPFERLKERFLSALGRGKARSPQPFKARIQ